MLKNIENGLVSTGLPVQDQGSGGGFLPSDSSSLDEIGKLSQAHNSQSSDPMLSELEQHQPQLIAASADAPKKGADELTGQDNLVFYNGFEKDLDGFTPETKADYSSEIVSDPTRAGDAALKFVYRKSDAASGAKRSEMRTDPVPAGSENWYGVSFFVPKDFKDTEGSFILNQFHSRPDKGEEWNVPPLFLVANDGQLTLGNRWDSRKITPKKDGKGQSWDLGPLPKGEWVDMVYHAKWSHKSDGLLEVFQDGKKVVSKQGPNSYNNENGLFMKFGMYASGITSKPEEYDFKENEIYFDEIKMAGADAKYADVAPG